MQAAQRAYNLAANLVMQGVAAPVLMPTVQGGISLEWHRPDWEFLLRVSPNSSILGAYFFDSTSDEEWEADDVMAAEAPIAEAFRRLVGERD
jgi:hypothetical protein